MFSSENFNHSYWELKQYFSCFDLIVVGSGIVGLSTAISYKEINKKAKVLVLERGILPNGASTKNAGFACFGSPGEITDDLATMPEDSVWQTVKMRWDGLALLRARLGDKNMAYQALGGFELFDNEAGLEICRSEISSLNTKMLDLLGIGNCYTEAPSKLKQFNNIRGVLKNNFEGQIDTALMMGSLLDLARLNGITILNSIGVTAINDLNTVVELNTNLGVFKAKKVVVATNGFASQLLRLEGIKPARAQVLITRPVKDLKLKGAYHYQQGYYYFRNIDGRILFGGGRNLDLKGETTTDMALNPKIQAELDRLLKDVILPGTPFEIEHRWSGIMGVGPEKKPVIKTVSNNVIAAVRMGGMGIAIGSWVGKKAAELVS